jgi:hypothetical protein
MNSKSLLTQTTLFPAHNTQPIIVTGLIDSGCSARAFADRNIVLKNNIKTFPLPRPRVLLLADGKPADTITDYFVAPTMMGSHQELCLFFITTLSKNTPLIFGLPWLQRHNPIIDWARMTIAFASSYCQAHCNRVIEDRPPIAPIIADPPRDYHDLPIAGEPVLGRNSTYQPPSVEDVDDHDDDEPCPSRDGHDLYISEEFTAGRNAYRTYAPESSRDPEHRGQIIPNESPLKILPAKKISLRRVQNRRPKTLPPPVSLTECYN